MDMLMQEEFQGVLFSIGDDLELDPAAGPFDRSHDNQLVAILLPAMEGLIDFHETPELLRISG